MSPRSGHLVSPLREIGFEFSGWQIAERGVKPLLVIDFLKKLADGSFRFAEVAIFIPQDLLILERFDERLASCVVPRIAFARHTDFDRVHLEQIRVFVAGVLRAAVGVMYQARLNDAA